ncbi:unnamed protein product [Lathyrus oleraceus]|uniref:Cell number regulator 6 n=1 Tax=Pisum sativum TaxID=3888 RepID=A0A9D4Y559_PEA|nr:cell number regulator 6 [Pisum sativum]KAI5430516.1 Cell number regulator 6 [Pisum sativum]
MGDQGSRYVKLTKNKEQELFSDITPGELNQPIDVPQLNARRCLECGQVLPETYQPPADEDWTTGICGCFSDVDSCWTGLFCPCVLFGKNTETLRDDIPWTNPCVCHAVCVEGGMALAVAIAFLNGIDPETSCLIAEGLFFTWWMCGIYTGLFRQALQKQYHLKDSPCDPCMVHCCLHWCAICQEHREMRNHLSDNTNNDGTIINPPPVQEIKSDLNKKSTSSAKSSTNDDEENNLQIQPI